MELSKVTLDTFEENLHKYDINKNSAGMISHVDFLTEISKDFDKETTTFLNSNIDRNESISKLNNLIKNIEISVLIEAGVYESALVYVTTQGILKDLLLNVYSDKLCEILCNLDKKNSVNNKTLLNILMSGEIEPQKIAFMEPHDIHPKRWEEFIIKNKIKEFKKKNMASTDMYKCRKCGERKCSVRQLQTRSSDEALTTYITCLVCSSTFKS